MKSKRPSKSKSPRHVGSMRLLAAIGEERILQLSNDMSEGITSGTTKEWRAVAYYFRHKLDNAYNDINAIRPTVAAFVTACKMVQYSEKEMDGWLKRVSS